jgi:nicotinate-nucleotide adenylyltransferase
LVNKKLEEQQRRVGVLGGTFDPVHYGHLVIAEEVRAALDLAEMVFVPAGHPPHKQDECVSTAADRLAMLELAITSNQHFSISLVDLERPGPSYTIETLTLLREQWGEQAAIYFVIGWDSLEDLPKWYKPVEVLARMAHLVAVHRPGYEQEPEFLRKLEARLPGISEKLLPVAAPQLAISSTDLRRRVAEGKPIRYQIPEAVERYIREHNLYRMFQSQTGDRERASS